MKPMYSVREGRRYRVTVRNASDDVHPLHLHRHSFELTRVGVRPTAGVVKDVVMFGGFRATALCEATLRSWFHIVSGPQRRASSGCR